MSHGFATRRRSLLGWDSVDAATDVLILRGQPVEGDVNVVCLYCRLNIATDQIVNAPEFCLRYSRFGFDIGHLDTVQREALARQIDTAILICNLP